MPRDSTGRSRWPDRRRRHHRSRSRSRSHSPVRSSQRYDRASRDRYRRKEDNYRPRSRERSQRQSSPDRRTRVKDSQLRNTTRKRSASPSSHKHRPQSESPSPVRTGEQGASGLTESELATMTEEEQMNALLGFGGFDSTKGKKVSGNQIGGANVKKQRKFRQYMNRKGGFNRLLDKQ